MAITLNGVKNEIPAEQIPSGYTRPTVTTFPSSEATWINTRTYNIAKANVENATASTTMTNIIDDATYGLDVLIETDLANDFVAANTVTAWAELKSISTNQSPESSSNTDWLNTDPETYDCTVIVYVKVA